MRNLIFLAVVLALTEVNIAAPVTVYETATSVETSGVSNWTPSAESQTISSTLPTNTAVQAGSEGGIMGMILSILSAFGASPASAGSSSSSSSSSSPSGTGSSGSSWLSILNRLFGGFGSSLASQTSSQASSGSTGSTAANTAAQNPVTTPPTSATPSKPSGESSPSAPTPPSAIATSGVYDAIYNTKNTIDTKFAKAILDSHNAYRAKHGVGPLSWADGPYSYAKINADNYDCSGTLTHTGGQYGENLAAGFPNGPAAVDAWYVEGETFDYNALNEYNHFTQVVWKGSTKVGCAYKDCSSKGWQLYVVCEYDPPGNFIGQERSNVLRPV